MEDYAEPVKESKYIGNKLRKLNLKTMEYQKVIYKTTTFLNYINEEAKGPFFSSTPSAEGSTLLQRPLPDAPGLVSTLTHQM